MEKKYNQNVIINSTLTGRINTANHATVFLRYFLFGAVGGVHVYFPYRFLSTILDTLKSCFKNLDYKYIKKLFISSLKFRLYILILSAILVKMLGISPLVFGYLVMVYILYIYTKHIYSAYRISILRAIRFSVTLVFNLSIILLIWYLLTKAICWYKDLEIFKFLDIKDLEIFLNIKDLERFLNLKDLERILNIKNIEIYINIFTLNFCVIINPFIGCDVNLYSDEGIEGDSLDFFKFIDIKDIERFLNIFTLNFYVNMNSFEQWVSNPFSGSIVRMESNSYDGGPPGPAQYLGFNGSGGDGGPQGSGGGGGPQWPDLAGGVANPDIPWDEYISDDIYTDKNSGVISEQPSTSNIGNINTSDQQSGNGSNFSPLNITKTTPGPPWQGYPVVTPTSTSTSTSTSTAVQSLPLALNKFTEVHGDTTYVISLKGAIKHHGVSKIVSLANIQDTNQACTIIYNENGETACYIQKGHPIHKDKDISRFYNPGSTDMGTHRSQSNVVPPNPGSISTAVSPNPGSISTVVSPNPGSISTVPLEYIQNMDLFKVSKDIVDTKHSLEKRLEYLDMLKDKSDQYRVNKPSKYPMILQLPDTDTDSLKKSQLYSLIQNLLDQEKKLPESARVSFTSRIDGKSNQLKLNPSNLEFLEVLFNKHLDLNLPKLKLEFDIEEMCLLYNKLSSLYKDFQVVNQDKYCPLSTLICVRVDGDEAFLMNNFIIYVSNLIMSDESDIDFKWEIWWNKVYSKTMSPSVIKISRDMLSDLRQIINHVNRS